MASTSEFPSSGDGDKSDDESVPPPKKKYTGAARYQTKFNNEWKREFSFVTSVPGDLYRLVSFCFEMHRYQSRFMNLGFAVLSVTSASSVAIWEGMIFYSIVKQKPIKQWLLLNKNKPD